jgi:hypothetical protein
MKNSEKARNSLNNTDFFDKKNALNSDPERFMRTKYKLLAAALALLLLTVYQPLTALGQGSLTPPGPPGATMLTLSQIEPRTPISAAFTITRPGSYYLTTNITINTGSAILIEANNVKLDLNGFTISSTASGAQGYAIDIGPSSTPTNVTIIDGFISSGVTNNSSGVFGGSGFGYGIYGVGYNIQVRNVSVSGCLYDGINVGQNSSVVESCTVNEAGNSGIFAQSVSDSTAANCGQEGILTLSANNCYGEAYDEGVSTYSAENCYGYSSGNGSGVYANTANNCYGYSAGNNAGLFTAIANNCYGECAGSGYGLEALLAATGSFGTSSSGYGLYAFNSALNCNGTSISNFGLVCNSADNCSGASTTSDGLVTTTAANCYGASNSGIGLDAITANGCYGTSAGTGSFGIFVTGIATGCYGTDTGGTGLHAIIANSCFSSSGNGSVSNKYNMP